MKTTFLSKMLPMAVFALGIAGAFFTTSMQNADALAHIDGWVTGDLGPCSVQVNCSTIETPFVCKVNGLTGVQARAMDSPTTCLQIVYKP